MKKIKTKQRIIVIAAIFFVTLYLIWRAFFTLPLKYGIVAIICGVIMVICEIMAGVENISHILMTRDVTEPELPVIPDEMYPEVDILVATHNEPQDILFKTINGCKHMRYPDLAKVHIWLCDDGNRKEVAELAEEMGVGYIGMTGNKHAKAGNLNNALAKTSAPLVSTLDADMIPTTEFLMKTVPYFYLPVMKKLDDGTWVKRGEEELDPGYKIGFIQTPQSFYNPDLFQYNLYAEDRIPNEQDFFFREINVSRNKTNSPIYAGSNTVISREALERVGGIATGTITEDFETGLHIQEEGYSCYAVSTVLVHGLAPDTIDSLIKQRERWGRGCVFSIKRAHIWRDHKIPLRSRWSYYACNLYWWSFFRRFIFVLAPIMFMIFNVPVVICEPYQMLIFWLPCYVMSYLAMDCMSSSVRNSKWSNVIDTILFPYMIIPIFLESIGVKKREFHVTSKERAVNKKSDIVMAIPHIILAILSFVGIIRGIGEIIAFESFGPVIVMFWLCMNFYALVLSIFFMLGRTNMRKAERYYVQLPAEIDVYGNQVYCHTEDISEGGMSLNLNRCIDLTVSETYPVTLRNGEDTAVVNARLVSFRQRGEGYVYSFRVEDMDTHNRAEFYQMIYDRHPSLPDEISKKDSVFLDIKKNIEGRANANKPPRQRRSNLRIDVKQYLPCDDGQVFVEDYNFEYFVVKIGDLESEPKRNLKVYPVAENRAIYFDGEFVKNYSNGLRLYRIRNHTEIAFNEELDRVIDSWMQQ